MNLLRALAFVVLPLLFVVTGTTTIFVKATKPSVIVPGSAATARAESVSTATSKKHRALPFASLRGGAVVPPSKLSDWTAKILLGTYAAIGTREFFAPGSGLSFLGAPSGDAVAVKCTHGSTALIWVMAASASLYTNLSPLQAIGVGQFPVLLVKLRNILGGKTSLLGYCHGIFLALVTGLCLMETPSARYFVGLLVAFRAWFYTRSRVWPTAFLASFGVPNDSISEWAKLACALLGQHGWVSTVLLGTLAAGIHPYKALGYAQIPSLLSLIAMTATGDFPDGVSSAKIYSLMLLLAASIGALLAW